MPFAEWLVHSRLLHAQPIAWRGRTLQSAAARAHAAHHADPRNERLVVTPAAALLSLLPVLALAAILPSWGLRVTAVAILTAAVLSCEWVHFLVHACPRRAPAGYAAAPRHTASPLPQRPVLVRADDRSSLTPSCALAEAGRLPGQTPTGSCGARDCGAAGRGESGLKKRSTRLPKMMPITDQMSI